jgi:hypothetical protein
MTKKLEELFNLPESLPADMTTEDVEQNLGEHREIFSQIDDAIDKIDAALPGVKGLDASDQEMDDLATMAKERFEDLMDLGMNMEARFSGQIFQTAGVLLGHAITAKQAKLDKKLRMVDLQLKKMRLDHQLKQDTGSPPGAGASIEGEGTVIDRNTLLQQILGKTQQ